MQSADNGNNAQKTRIPINNKTMDQENDKPCPSQQQRDRLFGFKQLKNGAKFESVRVAEQLHHLNQHLGEVETRRKYFQNS